MTGKQEQSPRMSTCGPDLHAHATFTGTHRFHIIQTGKGDPQICMHMCTHTPTVTMQPLAQNHRGHTHAHVQNPSVNTLNFHHRSALFLHPSIPPSTPRPTKAFSPSACLCYQACLCKSDSVSRSLLALSLLTHTHTPTRMQTQTHTHGEPMT